MRRTAAATTARTTRPVVTWRLVILVLLLRAGRRTDQRRDPVLDVERALGRVLEPADRGLGLIKGFDPGLGPGVELELDPEELEPGDLPELPLGPGQPRLLR